MPPVVPDLLPVHVYTARRIMLLLTINECKMQISLFPCIIFIHLDKTPIRIYIDI
jgi:hypothetical protein